MADYRFENNRLIETDDLAGVESAGDGWQRALGFESLPDLRLGDQLGGCESVGAFSLEVFTNRHEGGDVAPDTYLVEVSIGEQVETVLCPGLPELLGFLQSVTPILREAREGAATHVLHRHAELHQRRSVPGCIYCQRRGKID